MNLKFTWRIWILIIFILLSILAISPNLLSKGVVIKSVEANSTAFIEGLRTDQTILGINDIEIKDTEDYSLAIQNINFGKEKIKTTITTKEGEFILFDNQPPQITVSNIPKTNINVGLDLQGGARALIKAKNISLTSDQLNDLIAVTNNRMNIYGISDIQARPASDLEGNNYMLIEVAGATPKDLEELISKQGKFEAKIGNDTVFIGGERDITSVCRNDATCARIESCSPADSGFFCNFAFTIYLSEDSAQRHADITGNLTIENTGQGRYLSKKLDLYLDEQLVDSLLISESLKGRATTQIQIQGSGTGATRDEAITSAEESMKKLQTVLITGSLPYQLEIIKLDTISPRLGNSFIFSIIIAGISSILLISVFIFIRYRKIKESLAVIVTSFSEILIILGIASFIKWNLDLPSIAGILATIGTGVDQQIVILDESIQKNELSLKQKMKRALFILIATYFTAVVSLLPLMVAGAGLLKGFAVTSIIGITVGILITRPAFADMIKKIEE
ncbi:MAG: hypothetical protein AABY22_04050 [Nanoarchaeota archaeon]